MRKPVDHEPTEARVPFEHVGGEVGNEKCLSSLFWPDLSDGEFSRDFFIKDSIVEGTWTNCAGMSHEGRERARGRARGRTERARCEQELGPK